MTLSLERYGGALGNIKEYVTPREREGIRFGGLNLSGWVRYNPDALPSLEFFSAICRSVP